MSPKKSASAAKIFRAAESPATTSEMAFRAAKDKLRPALIALQQRLRTEARCPVIIVLAGVRGAGVIDTLNLLNTWMDPRWIATHAFDAPNSEQDRYPAFWRYWRCLPAAGAMGLFLDGWYDTVLGLDGRAAKQEVDRRQLIAQIATFERTLADDGALILKFWLHLDEAEHKQARRKHGHTADPILGLEAADHAWRKHLPYKRYRQAAANVIAATHTRQAPWHIIGGQDANHRRLAILTALHNALTRHFAHKPKRAPKTAPRGATVRNDILKQIDLTQTLNAKDYAAAFRRLQPRLYDLQDAAHTAGVPSVLMFEGWDAAGKSGAIRRLTYALAAPTYTVVPIGAPTHEERAHHYLWRFWRALGGAGHMTIFDRSWYGRVLVERVDRLIPEAMWRRAYDEIQTFEQHLTQAGVLLLKFWLHVDPQEQLERFKARANDPNKRWKLTDDDWHNRRKWNTYVQAVNEMVRRTSTPNAPWHMIPANNKKFARIAIMEIVAAGLNQALAARGHR